MDSKSSIDKPTNFVTNRYTPKKRLSGSSAALAEKHLDEHILNQSPLFAQVLDTESGSCSIDTSILVTGFGLRNAKSLQDALRKAAEKKRLLEQKRIAAEASASEEGSERFREQSEDDICSTQYDLAVTHSDKSSSISLPSQRSSEQRRQLDYLRKIMGCIGEDAGEFKDEEKFVSEQRQFLADIVDETSTDVTEAMRQAQKYLRTHKIFEFFQFLIAHLLSKLPDNPIDFLVDILDQCLVYRSGFGDPPLLYNTRHLEQLFYLMDPMRTGYIELEQYKTGMHTLGICSYNKNPPLEKDGCVSKTVFVEEAYDCLANLLIDMIRRRWVGNPPPTTPPPTPQVRSVNSSAREASHQNV